MVKPIVLTPGAASLGLLKKLLREKAPIVLDKTCFPKIESAVAIVRQILKEQKVVYGVNTGFGSLANQIISHESTQQLQRNIVLSHACGSGPLLNDEVVSFDSIPTSANQEDHVSMATNAALRLQGMIENTATILAIELLAASQGLDFLKPLKTSRRLQKIVDGVRIYVDHYDKDRYFAPDIEIIKQSILKGEFTMGPSV